MSPRQAPEPGEIVSRAASALRGVLGREPTLAAIAPGRVNLIGEHTDYNAGFVLPIAIDRWCAAVAAPAQTFRVHADDLGTTTTLDHAAEPGTTAAYVLGAVRLFERRGVRVPPLDLALASSVPIGGGLSSSAALTVAVVTIIEKATGATLDPREKVLLAQAVEHEFAGVPCGIMDPSASIFGRRDHALLIDCRAFSITPTPMPDAALIVFNTNVRHSLASGEYAARRESCRAAARALGVAELRDAEPAMLGALEPSLAPLARHVVSENARVLEAVAAMRAGDLPRLGRLMRESHRSLRDDYRVSCPELDAIVDDASGSDGVFGARMTGGGFGGCAIALTRHDAVHDAITRVLAGYQRRFGRPASAESVRAVDGAGPVALP